MAAYRTRRDQPGLNALRDELAEWVGGHLDEMGCAEPSMPLEDRAADTWEPLFAVANLAGGEWPERARAAALRLVGEAEEEDEDASLGVRLLADIESIFTDWTTSFLSSHDLVTSLRKIDDAPWSSIDLTTSRLAKRLRMFGIKPGRNSTATIRGYAREDFLDAFGRYLRQKASEGVNPPSDLGVCTDTPRVV